jgi:hypothetical protein
MHIILTNIPVLAVRLAYSFRCDSSSFFDIDFSEDVLTGLSVHLPLRMAFSYEVVRRWL